MEIEGRTREEAHPGRCFATWRRLDGERRAVLMFESATSHANMAHEAVAIHDGFHGRFPNDADIGEWVAGLNERLLVSAGLGEYAKVFVAVVDPVRMELSYVNAGSFPQFLYRAEQGIVERLPFNYPALALVELDPAPASQISLAPGDVLLCTNDGLTEMRNSASEEFGERGVLEFLREEPVAGTPAFELLARLFERLDAFGEADARQPAALAVRLSGVTRRSGSRGSSG